MSGQLRFGANNEKAHRTDLGSALMGSRALPRDLLVRAGAIVDFDVQRRAVPRPRVRPSCNYQAIRVVKDLTIARLGARVADVVAAWLRGQPLA
jgi:hypothetical protein